MLELLSILLGVLIGMLIMLILVWITYSSRAVFFSRCAVNAKKCLSSDYIDPDQAIAAGKDINSSLFVGDGKLYYRRLLANSGCHPDIDQTVHIHYPKVCSFSSSSGTQQGVLTATGVYRLTNGTTIQSLPNCLPITPGYTGTPLPLWE